MKSINTEGSEERPSVFSMYAIAGKSDRQPARELPQAADPVSEMGVLAFEFIVWALGVRGVC
jgi:hypothetical protein